MIQDVIHFCNVCMKQLLLKKKNEEADHVLWIILKMAIVQILHGIFRYSEWITDKSHDIILYLHIKARMMGLSCGKIVTVQIKCINFIWCNQSHFLSILRQEFYSLFPFHQTWHILLRHLASSLKMNPK